MIKITSAQDYSISLFFLINFRFSFLFSLGKIVIKKIGYSHNPHPTQFFRQFIEALTQAHGMIGSLSNGKDMRWHLIPPLASVQSNSSHGVDGEPLVGVHSNTEEPRVGLKTEMIL